MCLNVTYEVKLSFINSISRQWASLNHQELFSWGASEGGLIEADHDGGQAEQDAEAEAEFVEGDAAVCWP